MHEKLFLPLNFLLLFALATILVAEFKTGETYHGFKLIDKRFVKEVSAECLYFKHVKSGARLVKIAAEDANKTFSIAFKTKPESDAGTPHIMEHSLLNGSKNFPVKSPFDVLAKGSLNTFLNAMTGPYVTIYPVASMNEKDYFNLMHVYLDAVFYPLIYDDPRILKQEGWHYELLDEKSAVEYKGVVYNEMRGVFSDPNRELNYQINKHLFPDNAFAYSSGGYPASIPSLSFAAMLDYHRRYYHPSNSYIFLYGNADLDKELAFINAKYLVDFDKADIRPFFPLQMPFKTMKEVTKHYAIPEGENTDHQTFLTMNFVVGLYTDQALYFSLDILSDVLVNQESAPIRLALQEAGIGRDVSAFVDNLKQNVLQIIVQNANPQDKDKFREIVLNTLRETAKQGLDKEAVEGTINRMEFRLKEGDDAQKGITYSLRTLSWLFADDPFLSLEYEKPLAEVKKALTTDYLESIIRRDILDNQHTLLLVLEPKPGLEKENKKKISADLASFKANLSKDEIASLVQETKDLIAYQKQEDKPEDLATIPLLDIQDINPEVEWYRIEEKEISETPVLYHEDLTNDVVYVELFFDTRVLPVELIPYSALLAEILGSMNTKNFTYGDLSKALNIHTGGFSVMLNPYLEDQHDANLIPKFVVSTKALNQKTDKLFELVEEIVNNTIYADKDRLKAVLTRHQSRVDNDAKQNGFRYAVRRLDSYFSNNGMFNELTNGFEYYWFINDLSENFEEKANTVIANLAKTASLLFQKDNLIAGITCGKEDYPVFSAKFRKFIKNLSENESKFKTWTFNFNNKNEGILTASKVQYVIQGYDFKKLGYEWNGKMYVLNQILSSDWLQNQIRVIGGAYGGMSSFQPNGRAYFASYRDPNLKETLDNYSNTPEYLRKFEADAETIKRYIIGTIARMDRPLTASQKGSLAMRRFFEKTSKETIQNDRFAILNTTPQDIRDMEKLVSDILAQKAYCVYGNKQKMESEKELFNNLVNLNK